MLDKIIEVESVLKKTITEDEKDIPKTAFEMVISDDANFEEISKRLQWDMFFNEIYDWYYFLNKEQQSLITSEDLSKLYNRMIEAHSIENRQEAYNLSLTKH